jgi:hypothetical protein
MTRRALFTAVAAAFAGRKIVTAAVDVQARGLAIMVNKTSALGPTEYMLDYIYVRRLGIAAGLQISPGAIMETERHVNYSSRR